MQGFSPFSELALLILVCIFLMSGRIDLPLLLVVLIKQVFVYCSKLYFSKVGSKQPLSALLCITQHLASNALPFCGVSIELTRLRTA